MIALNQRHRAVLAQFGNALEHIAAVGALINQVAQEDQVIVGGGRNGFEQRIEGMHAAVNVADRDPARRRRMHQTGFRQT